MLDDSDSESDNGLDIDLDLEDDDYYDQTRPGPSNSRPRSRPAKGPGSVLSGLSCFGDGSRSSESSSESEEEGPSVTRKRKTTGPRPRTATAPNNTGNRNQPQLTWREAQQGEKVGATNFREANSGCNLDLDHTASPLQFLFSLLSEPIVDDLIGNINDYAEKRIQMNTPLQRFSTFAKWQPLDRTIFFRFLAVLIAMGLTPKHDIKDYFSTKSFKVTPWFRQMFSRTSFLLIYQSMLHAADRDAQGAFKIEPFVNALIGKFQQAFYPFENICIDEMVIGHKGRFRHKQFNSAKPKKYHIKTFGLCDSVTGYVQNLLIYFGANTAYNPETDPDASQAVKIFSTLLGNINRNHHLFADRYYSSLPVVQYLLQRGIAYTGMLNANRRGFPADLKDRRIRPSESRWFVEENQEIMCVVWRDKKSKKPCQLVTSNGEASFVTRVEGRSEVQKPHPIHQYNNSMNGCDRTDQMVSYYGNHTRKTVKWWKKIFMWIFEITQVNSHILFSLTRPQDRRPLPLAKYKEALIEELCQLVEANINVDPLISLPNKPGRKSIAPVAERFVGATHLPQYDGKDLACVLCAQRKVRKRSSFHCVGCSDKPHLCVKNCFLAYHTK